LLGTNQLFGKTGNANPLIVPQGGLPDLPHFAPKAKRIVYLFQSGGPPWGRISGFALPVFPNN
ncbi:MAG: hypothetical protein AAFP02_23795, partial [Bacteroidota bacterium]